MSSCFLELIIYIVRNFNKWVNYKWYLRWLELLWHQLFQWNCPTNRKYRSPPISSALEEMRERVLVKFLFPFSVVPVWCLLETTEANWSRVIKRYWLNPVLRFFIELNMADEMDTIGCWGICKADDRKWGFSICLA